MNEDRDEEAIFHLARRILDSEARRDYLVQICAGDAALLERVEALLAAHENKQSLLGSQAALGDTTAAALPGKINLSSGQQVGRFKLLQQIGEGGFGVVFMAEQVRPVRRKVALKVIKPGMDSDAVVARFEAERQALAMMDHPTPPDSFNLFAEILIGL